MGLYTSAQQLHLIETKFLLFKTLFKSLERAFYLGISALIFNLKTYPHISLNAKICVFLILIVFN